MWHSKVAKLEYKTKRIAKQMKRKRKQKRQTDGR